MKNVKQYSFADDFAISSSAKCRRTIIKSLNKGLNEYARYCKIWKLKVFFFFFLACSCMSTSSRHGQVANPFPGNSVLGCSPPTTAASDLRQVRLHLIQPTSSLCSSTPRAERVADEHPPDGAWVQHPHHMSQPSYPSGFDDRQNISTAKQFS